jgi:hypothetical protein
MATDRTGSSPAVDETLASPAATPRPGTQKEMTTSSVEMSSATGGDGGGESQDVKERAQEAAGGAVEEARNAARRQVAERSTQVGERVSSVAQDLRGVTEKLSESENEQGARLARSAAEQAEKAGTYLSESDGDRILHDVEDLARRQPWLVLAGGVALGVAAARMLKASSAERYRHSNSATQEAQPRPSVQTHRTEATAPPSPAAAGVSEPAPSAPVAS